MASASTTAEQEGLLSSSAESICSDPEQSSASSAATSSSSPTLSRKSSKSSLNDLPNSVYDGSHLHWKTFRQHVLAPHRIRVLENPPRGHLPQTFLSLIEAQSKNIQRFTSQKECFREQVSEGRGFGPSPLFPPNLLPSIEDQPQLARCMIPALQREALPPREINHAGPLYALSVPRPGLGCGFSSFAFSNEEIQNLPSYLVGTGTSVDFSTGYISPSHAIYCPFIVFERASGTKEHRIEAANNQCATGGAYCCRALQMLYTSAYKDERLPSMPVSFSCTVDNDFAIINYHWIDHEQVYHMAPLCKFDLRKDEHFSHFAAWIEAIGHWALAYVLPQVREALSRLSRGKTASPGYVEMKAAQKLTLVADDNKKNDMLIKSLKTTFDNIPWQFEDDDFTPVNSSTASWGSPIADDISLSGQFNPQISRVQGIHITLEPDDHPPTPRASLADVRMAAASSPPAKGTASPQPPAYTYNPELVSLRRLDHAMDEIRDLHGQLEAMRGSNTGFREEITGLRDTLGTILRKESASARTRSLLSRRISSPDHVPSSPTDAETPAILSRGPATQPQRPASQPLLSHHLRKSRPEMLQIRTDLPPAAGSSNLRISRLPGESPPSAQVPSNVTLSCNGVGMLLSPNSIKRTARPQTPCFDSHKSPLSARPQTPSFDSHKSPLSARAPTWQPRTPRTPMIENKQIALPALPALPPSPPATPAITPKYLKWYHESTPPTQMAIRWAATMVSGYVLVNLVPHTILTWLVAGCAADYALRTIVSGNTAVGALGLRGPRLPPPEKAKSK